MSSPKLSAEIALDLFPGFGDIQASDNNPPYISGLEGSALAAFVASQKKVQKTQSTLVIMEKPKDAELLVDDLKSWFDEDSVLYFPGLDLKPYEMRNPFGQLIEQRLQVFNQLMIQNPVIVVTTLSAFIQKLNSPSFIKREIISLEQGLELDLESLRETLIHMGFTEESLVEEMGQFSVRGGIVDLFPYLVDNPIRLELWGDTIESLREFDIFSQRTVQKLERAEIFPFDECCFSSKELEDGLLDIADKFEDSQFFESEIFRLTQRQDRTGLYWQKAFFSENQATLLDFAGNHFQIFLQNKDQVEASILKLWDGYTTAYHEASDLGRVVCPPKDLWLDAKAFWERLEKFPSIATGNLDVPLAHYKHFEIEKQTAGGGNLNSIQEVIDKLHQEGYRIFLTSPQPGQAERLKKIAAELPIEDVLVGHLSSGFINKNEKLALFTDHQIFNRFSSSSPHKKWKGGGVSIPNFDALSRGDVIVHQDYGIGQYIGIKRVKIENHSVDCILLQYKGNDKLTIPVSDLPKIQKYSSKEGASPMLSKLGGKTWEQQKSKTKKSIIKLARDLIELYAKRSAIKGFAFSNHEKLQQEFDGSFSYSPTPDQIKAFAEVKGDMEQDKPMDRLVCGDVGFGKTEVAMRAIFKAISDKKQVALVAPTTLLVSQHYASSCERFSDWPIQIEFMNRFKTSKEEKDILKRLAEGKVDLIVGTHRLFSQDVQFKDLGLIIIDEEQKFGVKQKEKLKKARTEVDVLSLSATPIPRSLHMSLVGARNFSVILTPPRNRLPIDTRVVQFDKKLLREAIDRELDRGGQCFFVHDRVMDLEERRDEVQELVPHARVGMAHGQMNEKDLERVMLAFINREFDILVSTTIIESGIDLPNVNTIIINHAHHFGLSQLFQMRGRVGRSGTQAFCLLVAPPELKFTDEAKKRLYSMQKFTELGSGYQLAMRDLEIRGAGNILGTEQSGHITAVGFDTYCRLLREAVQELQNRREIPPLEPIIEITEDAYLPELYITDGLQRITLYQKISRCETREGLDEIKEELKDRYGEIPVEAIHLLDSMKLKLFAQFLGFEKLEIKNQNLFMLYSPNHQPGPADLAHLSSLFKQPARFINQTPLQIILDLPKKLESPLQFVVEELSQIAVAVEEKRKQDVENLAQSLEVG